MPRAQTRWLGAAFEAPRLANWDAANITCFRRRSRRCGLNPTKHLTHEEDVTKERKATGAAQGADKGSCAKLCDPCAQLPHHPIRQGRNTPSCSLGCAHAGHPRPFSTGVVAVRGCGVDCGDMQTSDSGSETPESAIAKE